MKFPFASSIARACLALACLACLPNAFAQNTFVRITTTQGAIDLKLLDTQAPATVANFLGYVTRGDYTDVFVHRDAWNSATVPFVIQTGGYKWPVTGGISSITRQAPVVNEFSPARSNVRGTMAMAKLGGDPNSATSEWFVNMSDNSLNLDNQNGGFTVFARVTQPGMVVADRISNLVRANVNTLIATFTDMPLQNWGTGSISVTRNNAVLITDARVLASQTTADRVFNYLEAMFPQYASPMNGAPGTYQQYSYRFYAGTNVYVGTDGTNICYKVPAIDDNVHCDLGTVAAWFNNAQAAGY